MEELNRREFVAEALIGNAIAKIPTTKIRITEQPLVRTSGVIIIEGNQLLAAPSSSTSMSFVFTPKVNIRVKRVTSWMLNQPGGVPPSDALAHLIVITGQVNPGIIYSVPGEISAATGGAAVYRFWSALNTNGNFFDTDLVLRVGTGYEIQLVAEFDTLASGDRVFGHINLDWEEI